MPGREYVCVDCGHRFGTPEGEATNARALMCPGCGSIDLSIVHVERPAPIVMRATQPAKAGDWWGKTGTDDS